MRVRRERKERSLRRESLPEGVERSFGKRVWKRTVGCCLVMVLELFLYVY